MCPDKAQTTMTPTAVMNAQGVPRTAEVLRAAIRNPSCTRQKKSGLLDLVSDFSLFLAFPFLRAMAIDSSRLPVRLRASPSKISA